MDPRDIAVAGVSEVGADHGGGGGVSFDEVSRLGAPRKGFDADAAGSGIEIEHAYRLDPERGQHGEERLADPVRHWSGELPRRAFQLKSTPLARNDSHGGSMDRVEVSSSRGVEESRSRGVGK